MIFDGAVGECLLSLGYKVPLTSFRALQEQLCDNTGYLFLSVEDGMS